MDKKSIIAIVAVSLLIIFYWPILQFFGLVKPSESVPPQSAVDSVAVVSTDTVAPASPATHELAVAPGLLSDTTPVVADTITVTTNKYKVLLSTKGGGPVSIQLKDYTYRNKHAIELLPNAQTATPVARFAGSTVSMTCETVGSSKARTTRA